MMVLYNKPFLGSGTTHFGIPLSTPVPVGLRYNGISDLHVYNLMYLVNL